MNRRFVNMLESLVIIAILMVLVQTFLEDFGILSGWKISLQNKILLAGFFFDLFFTLEFLIRLYINLVNKRAVTYLTRERGWIDFLASVPLLMFNSGPVAFTILSGGTAILGLGGMLNLLKVIKAIRIARVLRFLRIIKIFRRIKNVSSPMAQRHIASITTISVTVLVFSLLAFSVLSSNLNTGLDSSMFQHQDRIATVLTKAQGSELSSNLDFLGKSDESLLMVKSQGLTLFSRYENSYYQDYFGPGDYGYVQDGDLELFFDLRPYSQELSKQSLIFFGIVLLMVLAYLLIYSPHFALTVSDPIHIMHRGFEESNYHLEVKIPEQFAEDDVFLLARLYNENYLPLKARSSEKDATELKIDDMPDLFD